VVVYSIAIFLFFLFNLTFSYLFTGTFHFGLLPPSFDLGSVPFSYIFSPPSSLHPVNADGDRIFTLSELSRYNGDDPTLPIYLAIKGVVYDVTAGKKYYGKGAGYGSFAGRDGSRAFLTGCFDEKGSTYDLRGLSDSQLRSIDKWAEFYSTHKTYKKVGIVRLPPIEEDSPLPNDNCSEQR